MYGAVIGDIIGSTYEHHNRCLRIGRRKDGIFKGATEMELPCG